jgi:multiple sugar transport system ATP-binding protein
MNDEGSVEIKNLVKTYVDDRGRPTFTAVKNISLRVENGEFMVLVGPSGCGKSTTLRMVAGLENITSGTISIGGRVVNDVEPKDRGIAMVFQNYALYPHMTLFNNMAFGLQLAKKKRDFISKAVNRTAKALGLANMLDRKPSALFGWAASARCSRTSHCAQSEGVSFRRTAIQSRREDACADALRDLKTPCSTA